MTFKKFVFFIVTITISLIIGYLYGKITYEVDFFVISATIIGFVVYYLCLFSIANILDEVAPRTFAVVLSVIFGFLISTACIYAQYTSFKNDITAEMQQYELSIEELDNITDNFLYEETGTIGVLGYYIYNVNNGSIIHRSDNGDSDGSSGVGPLGWLIEIIKILIIVCLPIKKLFNEYI